MSTGPTTLRERALAPDLARGCMLLAIALANSHYFLEGDSVLGGFPQDTGGLDRVTTWVIATFVDGRAFPMFGLLFGYGVARIVARQDGEPRDTRRLLWRRGAVLFCLGALDALLFYVGDILAAYGVLLAVAAFAVGWSDRRILILAGAFFVLLALPGDGSFSINADPPDASMLPPDPGAQITERLPAVAIVAFLGPLGFVCPFLVGLWAGRRRLLEHAADHVRLLRVTAVVGITAAVAGAQPVALTLSRVTDRPSDATLDLIGPLHDTTGTLGGFGYAALIALVALRVAPAAGAVTRALAATGQRSLTCYLLQSPVWFVLFTPYLLGLSDDLSVTATAGIATATWAATVLAADRMRAAGERGPLERLVRHVTYGRR